MPRSDLSLLEKWRSRRDADASREITVKVAGVALAIIALGLGSFLFHGLHRHGDGEAGDTAVDRAAPETAALASEVQRPGASLAGVDPPSVSKEEPVSPGAQGPAFVITGRVIDSITEEPVENAIVEIPSGQEVETDSGGRYRLEVLAGNHDVGAVARGYARTHASAAVTDPGETMVDLALDPVVEVIAQVADAEGVPLVGVTVTPSEDEDGNHYDDRDSAVTDLRGEAIVLRNSRFGATGPGFLARKEGYSQKEVSDVDTGNDGRQRVAIVLEDISRNAWAVMGRVTGPGGQPVQGALVTWNDGTVSYGPEGVVRNETASTDPQGRYRLEFHHQKTRFSFLAHARGFAPAWVQESGAGTPAEPATLDFVLASAHVVEGEVVGEDGEPLPGAKVVLRGPTGGFWNLEDILSSVPRTATTDDRGRFAIPDVPEGFVSLEVSKTGWSSGAFSGLPTGERHRLALYQPGNVRGRVVDSEGKPVSIFTVKVASGSNYSSRLRETGVAFTSTGGRFTIERLHRGERSSFTFRVESDGYAPAYLRDVRPEPEEREAPEHVVRLVKLGAATELAGKVIDARSGRPLSDVRVCAGIPRFDELGWSDWMLQQMEGFAEARTDGTGAFVFQEGEPLTLFIRAPGYRREVITPAMRPDRSDAAATGVAFEIALEPGESILGTFAELPGGKRPPGAGLISLRETGTAGEPAVSDFHGFHEFTEKGEGTSFAWDDLHPGRYLLFFDIPGEPGTTSERIYHRVVLREGSRESVRLGEDLGNLSFEGRLLEVNGRPPLQASVILRPLFAWHVEFECFSHDQQGSFAFRHLKPGRYAVEGSRYPDGKRQVVQVESLVIDADTRRDLTVEW